MEVAPDILMARNDNAYKGPVCLQRAGFSSLSEADPALVVAIFEPFAIDNGSRLFEPDSSKNAPNRVAG